MRRTAGMEKASTSYRMGFEQSPWSEDLCSRGDGERLPSHPEENYGCDHHAELERGSGSVPGHARSSLPIDASQVQEFPSAHHQYVHPDHAGRAVRQMAIAAGVASKEWLAAAPSFEGQTAEFAASTSDPFTGAKQEASGT